MYCVWQAVKTPTIISNNPVFGKEKGWNNDRGKINTKRDSELTARYKVRWYDTGAGKKKWQVWKQDRTKVEPWNSWLGIRSFGYPNGTFHLVWRNEINTSKPVWSKHLVSNPAAKSGQEWRFKVSSEYCKQRCTARQCRLRAWQPMNRGLIRNTERDIPCSKATTGIWKPASAFKRYWGILRMYDGEEPKTHHHAL